MTPGAAVELADVAKTFAGRGGSTLRAVDGVSFNVRHGEVLGIVGESGCGKSTLARLILGLLPASAGRIRVDGQDLAKLDRRSRARLIQPVFQDPFSSLNPAHRIDEIVSLPLRAQGGVSGRRSRDAVQEILARVGLAPDMAERYPGQLSGGQRQRVAIARALILRPRIVVCDEPTSALDVSVQAQILNLLSELRRELGLTLIFVSHNLAVVEYIADQVAVMYLGRVVEYGQARDVFGSPTHPYTNALLASVLTPDPALGVPDPGLGDGYPDPSNVPAGCRFHPRCPVAFAACSVQAPHSTALGTRRVECLLAEEADFPARATPARQTMLKG